MRTFISVELPDEIKEKIAKMIDVLGKAGSGIKWVEKKNLHITLKFLGWVPDEKMNDVNGLVKKASEGAKIFDAKFEGLGTFPSGRNPRVIWVGTSKGAPELKNLAGSIEKIMSKAGYRSEEREFASHVTVGRVKEKKNMDEFLRSIEVNKDSKFGETVVGEICVMKSALSPKGPIYEVVEKIRLS
ncbi:MAG: RNA 2',3'-cyclic phosphodiesterase [Candidatus Saganbacteria bacterium]|nr:RNA 2',3'-cyclic phosphodiesterase [Candidatus Saganbacteria bacterium]